MKVELAKDHIINGTLHKAGTALDLPINEETAAAWQKRGIILKPAASEAQAPATPPTPAPVKKS